MLSIRKTVQWSGKLKGVRVFNGELISEDGDVIDLMDYLEKAYGEMPFDITVTAKTDEVQEIETEPEEMDDDVLSDM